MPDVSSHASLDASSRRSKARKIVSLMLQHAPTSMAGRLLEVGTGSGYVAEYIASEFTPHLSVDAMDVMDQRQTNSGFSFQLYDGKLFPYNSDTFNVVVSNHVIEHVGTRADQRVHLGEILRVLADDGVAYLACPSRWQWREPHYGLGGLSWLPASWRDTYVRFSGKGARYDCNPFGHREFELFARGVGFDLINLNVEALQLIFRDRHNAELRMGLIHRIPGWVLKRAYRASPTMVYLMRKRRSAA